MSRGSSSDETGEGDDWIAGTSPAMTDSEEVAASAEESVGTLETLVDSGAAESGELIVVMKESADAAAVLEDGDVAAEVTPLDAGSKAVIVQTDGDLDAAAAAYAADPAVEFVQPNYIYTCEDTVLDSRDKPGNDVGSIVGNDVGSIVGNDVEVAEVSTAGTDDTVYQWGLEAGRITGVREAWSFLDANVPAASKVRVAVIDTGVQTDHPDLVGNLNVALCKNIVTPGQPVTDEIGHGTHVAGIIAAQSYNGIGVSGVTNNKAEVVVYKVFGSQNTTNTYVLLQAYAAAVTDGCRVINMSLGGYGDMTQVDQALSRAVDNAYANGVVTVASAGNGDTDQTCYPSDYDNVVSVIATDSDDLRASYSDHNDAKDIAAPGSDVLSTYPGGHYAYKTGTSMAAPYVAGILALILYERPQMSAQQAVQYLYATATELGTAGKDPYFGWGIVNADAAVRAAYTGGTLIRSSLDSAQSGFSLRALPSQTNLKDVRFAVWGAAGGQNDLRWYVAGVRDGVYAFDSKQLNIHGETGLYYVHAYGTQANGQSVFLGASSMTVDGLSGSVSLAAQNDTAGTFQIRVEGLQPLSALRTTSGSVRVAVWSEAGGQDDLVWYDMTGSGGTYERAVNIASHKYGFGRYYAHVYAAQTNGAWQFIGGATVDVKAPTVTATAALTADQTSVTLSASGLTTGLPITSVKFAVWGLAGGQNDLVWYASSKSGGTYSVQTQLSRHKESGQYAVHVYGYLSNGQAVFLGATSFTVVPLTASVGATALERSAGYISLRVDAVSPASAVSTVYGDVRCAVWTEAGGQDDLRWYSMSSADGGFSGTADLRNHGYEYGRYICHFYGKQKNGADVFMGSSVVTVEQPMSTVTASVSGGGKSLSLSATEVALLPGVQSVRFAVWGAAGGQNDLVWYSMTSKSGGKYLSSADLTRHGEKGIYYVHVYATLTNGRSLYIGGTSVTV
ncbi:MAG: GBS Bsp-like repeat-containing protein [Clostridiales Family XIII bacterium]|nr:GBS Bsp-like repeat-containing protein [Clostridiales Family XIII bacterium]